MDRRHQILLPLGCLVLGLGCFGTNKSSDRVGTVNGKMTIAPESPVVAVGGSIQFTASTPWDHEAIWSVLPAEAGTISSTGLFTASATPAKATVYAVWPKDVRYTASTGLSVWPASAFAKISPNLIQGFGGQQTVPGAAVSNAVAMGGAIPAVTSATADGAIQVRHGFDPTVK